MNLINIMLTSIKAKITPILTKVKLWFTPSYVKNKTMVKIRTFFIKLFDVKPKDETDYYTMFGWLVSKKLAFAIAIVVCLLCGSFLIATMPAKAKTDSPYKTYKYNSIPLHFVSDKVQILGKSGYRAYVGDVEKGVIKGTGSLYNPTGKLVYEGEFDANAFNGQGIAYYENTMKKYEGIFQDNVYEGEGKLYRDNGILLYEGDFRKGYRDGTGQLYNSTQELIYTGQFQKDHILYQELLGKSSTEVAQMYTGKQKIYEGQSGYCVLMNEINGIYYGIDGSNSLEEEFRVGGVYVLEQGALLEGEYVTNIAEIRNLLGAPVYEGNANLSEQDQVATTILCKDMGQDVLYGQPNLKTSQIFDNVLSIDDFDRDYLVYLYVFEKEDISYTFFCKDKDTTFDFYLMEAK